MSQSKRRPRIVKRIRMRRVLISIPEGLVEIVDEAAKKDFTSRSGIVRSALLLYLRPQGRDLNEVDPDFILKTLKQRKLKVGIHKMLHDEDAE